MPSFLLPPRLDDAERAEKARMQLATAAFGIAIWDWDLTRGELVWDDTMCRLYGVRREELTGGPEDWTSRVHPEDRDRAVAAVARALAAADDAQYEFRVVRPDGAVRHVRSTARAFGEPGKAATRVVGVNIDVTAEVEARAAARESDRRVSAIFENAMVGMALLDPEGRLLSANPALSELLGYSVEELTSMNFLDFTHPEDWDLDWSLYADLTQGRREDYRIQKRYVTRTGSVVACDLGVSAVRAPDGELLYCVGMVTDVTRRLAAEADKDRLLADLELRVRQLRLLHDTSVLFQEAGGDVRDTLAAWIALVPSGFRRTDGCVARLRYNDADLCSGPWLSSPWRLSSPIRLEEGSGVLEVVYRDDLGFGSDLPFLPEERQLIASLVEMIGRYLDRDVIERKRLELEARLNTTKQMQAMGALAGGVAHDFNNLLAAISGFAHLLTDDLPPDSDQHSFAARIAAACDRGAAIVGQIRSYARIGVVERSVVNLTATLEELEPVLLALTDPGVTLTLSMPSRALFVLGHGGSITQIVSNICKNASDSIIGSGRQRGWVQVELERYIHSSGAEARRGADVRRIGELEPGRAYARISISDDGPGIAPDVLPRIFEPFFTTRQRSGGTGLGLAIVYAAIEGVGGACEVCSRPGEGATFHIYLPKIQARTAAAVADRRAPAGPERPCRVVLIDDDEDVRDPLVRGLERRGFQVSAFADPVEAIRYVEAYPERVEIVVTDLAMPALSGTAVARAVKAVRGEILTVLHSGLAAEAGAEAPLDLVVPKPVDHDALADRLRGLVRRPKG